MKFLDFVKNNIVLLDGSTGSLMQRYGLLPGEATEGWSITHPETVQGIHRAYFEAGSNLVITNTFAASALKYDEQMLEKLIGAAFDNVRKARDESSGGQEKFIAFDIGPLGALLEPFGDLEFEQAVDAFSQAVRIAVQYGPDVIMAETFGDIYETRAAVTAIRENSDLPILVSNTYGKNGRLMTGADPETTVNILEGMGVDLIGVNCSFGPDTLSGTVREYLENASVPVSFKPNAGLPEVIGGKQVYSCGPEQFAEISMQVIREGVRLAGGCCGTSPDYIRALAEAVRAENITGHIPKPGENVKISSHSATETVTEEKLDEYRRSALTDPEDIEDSLCEAEPVCFRPADPKSLEKVLRMYNGKMLIDPQDLKTGELESLFELTEKYGAAVIAPDEGTGERRSEFDRLAGKYDIQKKDIITDS